MANITVSRSTSSALYYKVFVFILLCAAIYNKSSRLFMFYVAEN